MSRELRWVAVVIGLLALAALAFEVLRWRSVGVVLALSAVLVAAAYIVLVVRPARIPRGALLELRLSGALREYSYGSIVDRILGRGFPTLHHVRRALEAATSEPAIRTVLVEIAGLGIGMAAALELHDLLRAMRDSGKRVVALLAGDGCSPAEYLAASGAGEVVADPDCTMMMLGVVAGNVFLKQALDKLDIQAQVLQWKEYKGAAEIFGRERMSPALRESLEAIVNDQQRVLADAIARARGLEPPRARDLINGGFLSARQACEARLVDRIGYAQDLYAELYPHGKRKKIVSIGRMLRRADYLAGRRRRPRIALVYGVGPVITGERIQAGEILRAQETADEIEEAGRDPRVRALVFRVNSPGGSPVGCDLVWRAIAEARRRGMPVVVSMGDVAGSGGYYVATGADAIVAEPSTITGSIGVVFIKLSFQNLLARMGINPEVVKSGEISDVLSPTRPMSEAELGQLDRVMGELYENFAAKVAEGRKLSRAATEQVARGRVWSGEAALRGGLIDSLGGLRRAVEIARERAGLRPDQPHELTSFTPGGWLLGMSFRLIPTAEIPWAVAKWAAAVGISEQWAPALIELMARGQALFLCPIF